MFKPSVLFCACVLAALGASAAWSAPKKLDLSAVKAAAAAEFASLDKDGDGTLDAGELKGVLSRSALREADPDNDGTLTRKEYVALAVKLFHEADANHDGHLDAQELSSPAGQKLQRLLG